MNILPTASRPLNGFESYTGRDSCIIPHVKFSMKSIPSNKYSPTKFCYTTGTCTLRNYIQRKAGLKAEFHHSYGALLVEVDEEENWYCRQVHGSNDGTIYDLDVCVKDGSITTGNRVEAIVWGDIHLQSIDSNIYDYAWGKQGMFESLKPKYQFFHDILDFRSRTHHEIGKPFARYVRFITGCEDVKKEVTEVAAFLDSTSRDWCTSVVVDSNHNNHIGRWVQEQDARHDPINVEFWLDLQKSIYAKLKDRGSIDVHFLKEALELVGFNSAPGLVRFLDEDESFLVCGDIECGIHGHSGPNGSKGSIRSFARMGRRAVTGHTHSAGIYDGVYTVGVCADLQPDWTAGPSSWSHSHCLIYPNGKRSIVTMWNGRWKA
jgi:hypothetical protein